MAASNIANVYPFIGSGLRYAQLMTPITIDWDYLQLVRDKCVEKGGMKYLLMPEVRAIVDKQCSPRMQFAVSLMWRTGAHASEILSLNTHDFEKVPEGYLVLLSNRVEELEVRAMIIIAFIC